MCSVCGSKKSISIKEEEASGLLLGSNGPFKNVSLLEAIF